MKPAHLMTHCSATPEGRKVTPAMIKEWHLGPADLADGKVRYMGKTYDSRDELPDDEINGKLVSDIRGRGWRQVGYMIFVDIEGIRHELVENNFDDNIDPWEITNGAAGWNSTTFHICYAGGLNHLNKPADTRNWPQKETMRQIYWQYIKAYPDIKLIGHNQVSKKACPSYFVPHDVQSMGIPASNVDFNQYV